MDCAGCARTVETGVAQLDGVQACELSFTTERLRVSGVLPREAIIQRVRDLGYEAVEPAAPTTEALRPATRPPSFLQFMWARADTRLALLSALLVLPGVVLHEILSWDALWIDALALLAMALTIVPVARSAWRALTVSRELSINALMTMTTRS